MLLCDGCDDSFHTYCLIPPLNDIGLFQVDMYYCHTCSRGDGEEYVLLCDRCGDVFHTYCLIPPLNDIPLVSG